MGQLAAFFGPSQKNPHGSTAFLAPLHAQVGQQHVTVSTLRRTWDSHPQVAVTREKHRFFLPLDVFFFQMLDA